MSIWGTETTFDRSPASDLWRRTLTQIPSTFGRLVYLCSLRDLNTGRYLHFGLAQRYDDAGAEAALRTSHIEAFEEWLAFTLEEKKADVDLYLSALDGDRQAIIGTWHLLKPYTNVLPATAAEAQRELFLKDFETMLALLMNVHGVSPERPDA